VNELLKNTFLPATREGILRVIAQLRNESGAQAGSAVPLLDTTKIHVAAAIRQLWP
jgi:hypothetical protein